MKKLIMSAVMCVALMASTAVMAQDTTPKKDSCCKEKTEKKECTKDKKECTKKDAKKKDCCSSTKKAEKK